MKSVFSHEYETFCRPSNPIKSITAISQSPQYYPQNTRQHQSPPPDRAIHILRHNKSILPPSGKPLAAAASKAGKTQFPVPHFPALNAANSHSRNTPTLVPGSANLPTPAMSNE